MGNTCCTEDIRDTNNHEFGDGKTSPKKRVKMQAAVSENSKIFFPLHKYLHFF